MTPTVSASRAQPCPFPGTLPQPMSEVACPFPVVAHGFILDFSMLDLDIIIFITNSSTQACLR